ARRVAESAANKPESEMGTLVFRIIDPPQRCPRNWLWSNVSRYLSTAVGLAGGDKDGVMGRLEAAGDGVVPADWDGAHDLVGARVDLGDGVAGVVGGPHGAGADREQRRLLVRHRDLVDDLQSSGVDSQEIAAGGDDPDAAFSDGDGERARAIAGLQLEGLDRIGAGPDLQQPGGRVPGVVGPDPGGPVAVGDRSRLPAEGDRGRQTTVAEADQRDGFADASGK